jgi:hypothetical protein
LCSTHQVATFCDLFSSFTKNVMLILCSNNLSCMLFLTNKHNSAPVNASTTIQPEFQQLSGTKLLNSSQEDWHIPIHRVARCCKKISLIVCRISYYLPLKFSNIYSVFMSHFHHAHYMSYTPYPSCF